MPPVFTNTVFVLMADGVHSESGRGFQGQHHIVFRPLPAGTIPFMRDVEEKGAEVMKQRPLLMGQV
jgi:hypothetical protein